MEGLWVTNDPTPDGTYRTTITLDEDWSQVLTPDAAVKWARAFIDAGVRALYDAAVYAQLRGLNISHNDVGPFIVDLRDDRPPLDNDSLAPLRLEPGVNSMGKPFIGMRLNDVQCGQLTPLASMQHGMHVLEVITAADYDAGYHRMLKGVIGVEDHVASGAISSLRQEMEKLSAPEED